MNDSIDEVMDSLFEEAEEIRLQIEYYIKPTGLPFGAFEDDGLRGIIEYYRGERDYSNLKFADELAEKIRMPVKVVQSLCLTAAYLKLAYHARSKNQPKAIIWLFEALRNSMRIEGFVYGTIHKDEFNRLRLGEAARKRHKLDPKYEAKREVRGLWNLWKREPARYKSKSAFARDMLDKYAELGSQRVIERWCKEWESEPS